MSDAAAGATRDRGAGFRSRLDRIIDLTHALVKLSRAIDWRFLEAQSPGREARVDQALRYAHAHQFKRANRSLRRLKTYLGRVIRDIGRRIDGDPELEEIFARPLSLSRRVLDPRSIPCTRRKWSASARARRIGHTSSG